MYDYVFPENGLVAYHNGELFSKMVGHPLTPLAPAPSQLMM